MSVAIRKPLLHATSVAAGRSSAARSCHTAFFVSSILCNVSIRESCVGEVPRLEAHRSFAGDNASPPRDELEHSTNPASPQSKLESRTPNRSRPSSPSIQSPAGNSPSSEGNHIAASCQELGVEPSLLGEVVALYFETFIAFQLLRQQDFEAKLGRIATPAQTKALLAAVLAFAVKGADDNADTESDIGPRLPPGCASLSSSHLSSIARTSLDAAIAECEDSPLPLCVLQALILVTHWLLVQGVGGRASRYLGICVQSAYQLNLHLIDAGQSSEESTSDATRWCQDEERRRAWWAIWDMDVFSSVIGRCPVSIDWSLNETFLPAEDERWIRSEPQESCYLNYNMAKRWKTLSASGNKSPRAWLTVVNSYVKDAQRITSPTGVERPNKNHDDDAVNRLVALLNNLHCTSIFRSTENSLFLDIEQQGLPESANEDKSWHVPDRGLSPVSASLALSQYLESADEICTLVRRSHEDHHKYVNPYIANTIWLAGAVQLFHKRLAPSMTTSQELIASNFQVLNTTYKRFSQYWNISKTLQKNLKVVENELDAFDSQRVPNKSIYDEILALLTTYRGRETRNARPRPGTYRDVSRLGR
ncbi:hypothetical protein H9Q74_007403 [Fusarium xylarioides]|nr:hypothetical protein H9Q71_009105 [Fusarium xylarioides]KAG5822505.1 hypothetical protein H9Q74_007403 [Fusarium xylarioides]